MSAAIVAGAVIGGVAMYASSENQKKGAESAASAQSDAAKYAAQLQNQQYMQTRSDYGPYAQLGAGASPLLQYLTTGIMPELSQSDIEILGQNAEYMSGMGRYNEQQQQYQNALAEWRSEPLFMRGPAPAQPAMPTAPDAYELQNAMARKSAINALQGGWTPRESPMYRWQAQQLEKNLGRQLSARGRSNSSFGVNAFREGYQALAAQEADKQYGRLLDLVNIGRGAAGNVSNAGASAASNAGNALMAAGNAQAQGILGASQAQSSLYGNLGALGINTIANYQRQNALNQQYMQNYNNYNTQGYTQTGGNAYNSYY